MKLSKKSPFPTQESGPTSMTADDGVDSGVIIPKRPRAGVLGRTTPRGAPTSRQLLKVPDPRQLQPEEAPIYLDKHHLSGQTSTSSSPSALQTWSKMEKGKEQLEGLGDDQEYISLEPGTGDTSLDLIAMSSKPSLVSDDVDFGEHLGEMSAMPLSRRGEHKEREMRRREIKALIDQAENMSWGDDSDQRDETSCNMKHMVARTEGIRTQGALGPHSTTPPKVIPIPSLRTTLGNIAQVVSLGEDSKQQLTNKLKELHDEELQISRRKEVIATLLKAAGDTYEHLARTCN
ncbi:predicted protein [Uncinocarpus reesii 1704]|uniref:Uncharacterized protein n=1 Tax=Uncinocarpus reesii (strain UAMH 1704) TaxID=336963 RepID=C4JIL7_UNCRE|nr:uncharacterized protein UREG_01554 [Uncinocarpus reesii 1704]EEP76705.1 predicted protein [Uncinocarpus reesii 1704]